MQVILVIAFCASKGILKNTCQNDMAWKSTGLNSWKDKSDDMSWGATPSSPGHWVPDLG